MAGKLDVRRLAARRRRRRRRPSLFISSAVRHRRRRWAAGTLAGVLLLVLVVAARLGTGSGVPSPGQASATAGGHAFGAAVALLGRLRGREHLGVLASRAAEDRAIDRTLRRTPYVRVAGRQHREVALTFDDGPGPYTPAVLRVLRARHVAATFFEVGQMLRYFHVSASAELAAGHVVGDHTENHPHLGRMRAADQRAQIDAQVGATRLYGVPYPRLFRPPYGSFDVDTTKLLRRRRMLNVLWTIDAEDYRQPGVAAIVQYALARMRPGAIVLLHDGGGNRSQTVAALPIVIARLRRRGYRLVTVPRLLLDNPPPVPQRLPASLHEGGG